MSRRSELSHEIALLEKQIKEAPADTPADTRKLWEDRLVDLSFEVNNLVDDDNDNDE